MRLDISTDEWVECLRRLRDARALILRDSEAFHGACIALERVGQILGGKLGSSLWDYQIALLELTSCLNRHKPEEVERLLNAVRAARNTAVHEGAWARHLSTRAVDLFLILEEAVMAKLTTAEHVMVRNPTVAEAWNLVSHARQSMLANSFSYLPILVEGKWKIISDVNLVRFLRAPLTGRQDGDRLSMRLDKAITSDRFLVCECHCCEPEESLENLSKLLEKGPVLVTEEHTKLPRLLGIITSFDLL